MAVQNYVVLTSTQVATAQGLDSNSDYAVAPRAVDNGSPGVGININPDAATVVAGSVVTLVGTYVLPKRIVDDPDCATYAPNLRAWLLTLPWAMLEAETIFMPVPPL